ncbi:MAG: pilus assembly protein TadG-related protein [Hyphomicrobium sp.]
MAGQFIGCSGGGTAALFGITILSVCAAAALGLDYGRARAVQVQLQAAADAAILAARSDGADEAAIEARAKTFFRKNAKGAFGATITGIDVDPAAASISIEVTADVKTTFAGVFGQDVMQVRVVSEATVATESIELALVLDNTGSMAGHMDDLKQGALDLVTTVRSNASDPSKIAMAVVPYVGAVNIGNGTQQHSWLDQSGDARHHGEAMEWMYFGFEPGCSSPGGGGSGGAGSGGSGPGNGTTGSLFDRLPAFASILWKELAVTRPAAAANATDVPAPFNFGSPCWIASPSRLNVLDLFDKIPNSIWKGCVEARAEPYDATDETPDISEPDTLFVPWFWPDESDNAALAAQGAMVVTANDYLPDRLNLRDAVAPRFTDPWAGYGINNVLKYNGTDGAIDEVAPDTSGPNKSCGDAVLPLTSDLTAVTGKINGLMHWNGSGTNVAEGLAWGWRVLSPTAPFTEGAPYGTARKVLVLMTDGVNNVDPAPDVDRLSHYSAYGYLQQWGTNRIATKTYAGFKDYADGRLQQVCTHAKSAGISIYTVAFGITDQTTLDLLEGCATEPVYAYTASTAADLVQAFRDIAVSLTDLRLSK